MEDLPHPFYVILTEASSRAQAADCQPPVRDSEEYGRGRDIAVLIVRKCIFLLHIIFLRIK